MPIERRLWLVALLTAAHLPAVAQGTGATGGDATLGPYYVALGQSVHHESNIYRLSEGVPPAAGASRADTVAISSLAAGLDTTLSRQRLRADLSLRSSRFRHNESLDNRGHGLRLAWNGSTAGRWSGSASASVDRSLVQFDTTSRPNAPERNLATTRQADVALRWGMNPGWAAELGAAHVQVGYSAALLANREYRQNSANGHVRWSSGAGLSASLGVRAVEGRFPRFAGDGRGGFVADRYDGQHLDLGLLWAASPQHQVDGRISAGRTRYERATATDLSGLTGQLNWSWRPTAKLKLLTRAVRDRGQESAAIGFSIGPDRTLLTGRYADFSRVSNSLATSLEWAATAKLGLTASAQVIERDLVSAVVSPGSGTVSSQATGSDRSTLLGLGVRWQATRGIVLGCDVGTERRRADNTSVSSNLDNRTRNCFGQVAIP